MFSYRVTIPQLAVFVKGFLFFYLIFYFVLNVGLMPYSTASIFEHIAAKGNHVVIFHELVDLFFGDFHVVTIPHNRTKVKVFLSLFSIFYYLLNAVHKGYGKQGQKWGRKEKSNERNVVSHEVTIPQPAGKSRSFYLFFLLDRSQVKWSNNKYKAVFITH